MVAWPFIPRVLLEAPPDDWPDEDPFLFFRGALIGLAFCAAPLVILWLVWVFL